MSSLATASRPTHPRRNWRTRAVFVLFVLIPACFTLFAYVATRYLGTAHLENAFAEADRLDPGWRFDDIEAKRLPYPSADKNGIDQVLRVKSAMPASQWPAWPFPQFDPKADHDYLEDVRQAMDESLSTGDRLAPTLLNAEQERVLRLERARAAEAVELARAMPNYPYGRYAIKWAKDWVGTLLPHVQETRQVAYLMDYDARLRAQDNDLVGALHDVKAVLYASRAVGDEEILISQLVRMAVDLSAISTLERTLACGRAPEPSLLDLQKELEKEAQTPFFLAGVRGERASLNEMLQNIQDGTISFTEYWRLTTGLTRFVPPRESVSNYPIPELKSLRMYVNLRNERARMLHYFNGVVEAAKLPTWEQADAIDAQDKLLLKEPGFWVAFCPASHKVAQADLRTKATLRTAYTALAMERFNLANGRWPDKLDELVPKYLSSLPLDPYDGAPLRLSRKGSAVIVYSISQDKVDQGGVLLANPTNDGSDIGFILQDPQKRRQPGKPFVFPPRPSQPATQEQPDHPDGDR
jgi:hypothetical protein